MIATALVQNGAKVYIASRKESQLKEVALPSHTIEHPSPSILLMVGFRSVRHDPSE